MRFVASQLEEAANGDDAVGAAIALLLMRNGAMCSCIGAAAFRMRSGKITERSRGGTVVIANSLWATEFAPLSLGEQVALLCTLSDCVLDVVSHQF